MWLYICACLVLLNIVKCAQAISLHPENDKPYNDAPKQTDILFADVIKNISRVNNVLQELITNYEQLQNIYKSQENEESAYSDPEIDEIFKRKKKEAIRSKNEEIATKKPHSEKFAATQMFWSDHEEDDESSDDDDDESKDGKETIKENEKKVDVKTTSLKPVTSSESELSDESSDTSAFKENIMKPTEKSVKKSESFKVIAKPKEPEADVIFIDTHNKSSKVVDMHKKPKKVKPKPKIEFNTQFFEVPPLAKTRYNKVNHYKVIKEEKRMPYNDFNDTKNVKKVVYSETFSPMKIWNDIINNKPIKLEALGMEIHGKDNNNKFELNLRNYDKKAPTKITIPKKKIIESSDDDDVSSKEELKTNAIKNKPAKITKSKKKIIESPEDDDDVSSKEKLKTNAIREAYGESCLKVVIRKCFKACKKASKSACSSASCKSAARADFIKFSKTGCIHEFQGDGNKNKKATTAITMFPVLVGRSKAEDTNSSDIPTTDILSMTCLPLVIGEKENIFRSQTPADKNETSQNFNVLRNRFEVACKKISSRKCKNACNYAYLEMCKSHKCSKVMKKAFKNHCKKQCKHVYKLFRHSDGSTDSDSDDSDDDSDDDNDSSN